MTTEFVLLLGLYAFILIGAFLGERGPGATFRNAGPRFAAKVERNVATGRGFINKNNSQPSLFWQDPGDSQ